MIHDFEAMGKWQKIPKEARERILNNVFCGTCGVTRIEDYSIEMDVFGIILKGRCQKCKKPVARVVEDA